MRKTRGVVFPALSFTGVVLVFHCGFITAILGLTRDLSECVEYEKVGCFRDKHTTPRPLPKLIANLRGFLDWSDLKQMIKSTVLFCAEAASRNGLDVFGLQYYGECWSGANPGQTYSVDGPSADCLMAESKIGLKSCNDALNEECTGVNFTNYVYRLLKPVNGSFTDWSAWSQCSTSCGRGKQKRVRSCNNPSPSRCGKDCSGDIEEVVDCNIRSCPVPCVNNHEKCDVYKGLNLCTDSFQDVMKNCRKSCGLCS